MIKTSRWFVLDVFAFIATSLLWFPFVLQAAPTADTLIKASGPAVYYHAADGKRYVFPNEGTYKSWFTDFTGVVTLTDEELAAIPIGGNVTYRPGIRMIKIQSDLKVYAVGPGGTLRWIVSQEVAEALYGQYWNLAVDDVSDAFFVNYRIGDSINTADGFQPLAVAEAVDTINADKGLPVSPFPRRSDTEVANIINAWRDHALADINRHRAENGKGPVRMNELLNRIATIHSRDMALFAKNLQHEGSLGESPDDRMRKGRVPDPSGASMIIIPHPLDFGWSGENVGYAQGFEESPTENIERLHRGFMDEPVDQANHRTTMLSTFHPYDEVGIGPYLGADGKFWLTEDYISH